MSLRICTVRGMQFWDPSADPLTPMTENFLSFIRFRPQVNISWVFEESPGGYDWMSGRLLGCMGSLERNESDATAVLPPQDYYSPDIDVENIAYSDSPVIGTHYKVQHEENTTATHVLDFLSSYSFTHWFLTTAFALVVCCLMSLALVIKNLIVKKKRKDRKKIILMTIIKILTVLLSCLFKQHPNCQKIRLNSSASLFYILLTILSFFITLFLTSMIKTEMVVQKRPQTYDSYQDIIDQDVTPLWGKAVSDELLFENSRPGSKERLIWDRAVERGLDESLIKVSYNSESTIAQNMPFINAFLNRTAVSLGNRILTQIGVSNGCAFIKSMRTDLDVNGYTRVDPEAKEFLRTIPVSRFMDKKIKVQNRRRHLLAVESGFMEYATFYFRFAFVEPDGYMRQVMECMSNVVMMPDHELVSVPVSHFADLFTVCFIFVLLSCPFLVIEIWTRTRNRVTPVTRNTCVKSSIEE